MTLTDSSAGDGLDMVATVTEVELIGRDRSTPVFEGRATVDFKSLSGVYELFTIERIDPGDYDRLRVRFGDVSVIEQGPDGTLVKTSASLPSDSNDVVIEQPLQVNGGDVLSLMIEFDVAKSLSRMQLRNGSSFIKPVLKVRLDEDPSPHKVTRVHGRVAAITPQGYRLCGTQWVSATTDGHRHANACIDVALDQDTGFFDQQGLPGGESAIEVGSAITAVGFLDHRLVAMPWIPFGHLPPPGMCRFWYSNLPPGHQPPPGECEVLQSETPPANAVLVNEGGAPVEAAFGLDALVVEAGEPGTYQRFRGVATTAVSEQTFAVDVELGLVSEEPVLTRLFDETRVFSTRGVEQGTAVIQPEVKLYLDGVPVLSDSQADVIRAAFILVDLDDAPEVKLSGTILMVNVDDRSMTVATDLGDRCVDVEQADLFEVTVSDGQLVSEKVTLSELEGAQAVDVFGVEGTDGCFVANTLIAEG